MEIPVRGRKEPPTKLERIFWQEFPNLLVDDPDERLNEIIGTLRNTAVKYFEDKNSRQLDALVIPQKQVITSEGIDIKNYPIHKPLKFENTMLPLWITILVISIIFFGISLAMFLSV